MFGLWFVWLPAVVGLAQVSPNSSPNPNPRMTALLLQLEQGSPEQRRLAEQALLEIGPPLLPWLPEFPETARGRYREAVERLRETLQNQGIDDFSKPSRVTIQGKLPAADVLLELMDQSGNRLAIDPLPMQELDLSFNEVPFWQALDQVLDALQLEIDPRSPGGTLQLLPRRTSPLRSRMASYSGSLRWQPLRIDAARTILPDKLDRLRVAVELAWEPRLKPVYFQLPMQQLAAECDNGEILRAASPEATTEYTPADASRLEAALMLTLPSRRAQTIVRLTGSVLAAIPGAPVTLTFGQLGTKQPQEQRTDKLRVKLESFAPRDGRYACQLLVSLRDAGQTLDSYRGWLSSHQAFLLNADGQRVENAGCQTYRMNSEEVGLTYFFELEKITPGCQLVYVAPGSVSEQQWDFMLQDIPLP
jgi:hypothetical protein